MFLVGLTGSIGTGKSTVAEMFCDLGCRIIDADLIAREVVEPMKPAWWKIRKEFGTDVFNFEDGSLKREEMGRIVFGDEQKRRLLNSIIHPQIIKSILWKIFWFFIVGNSYAILDIPLLFESRKMVPYMSYTIVVSCEEKTQIQRIRQRNNYSTTEVQQRINAQMPLADKCARATYVIDNSGTKDETRKQVEDVYRKINSSKKHWIFRLVLLSGFGLLFYCSTFISRAISSFF